MANSERKRKRRKNKRDNRKLLPGEEVEVLYCDEGLNGSWHMGVVIDCGERSRLIEYINLLSEDNCSKLKELIPVSAAIEGLFKRTLRNHRGQIRPSPPHYGIQQSEIKYGLCVDALVDDAWWEGVVFDRDEGSAERLVFFPDQGDQQMVTVDRLRVTQDWNEVSGDWKPRGKWLLLQVLQPFEHDDTLPVSIREIWYDLRTTAAFSDKIGVWTFGSRSIWHSLVSELIQELQSVAHGLIATKQLIDVPMSCSVVDGSILQKDGAGVNTGLAVAVNNFQCSKLRTPDDRSLSDSSPSTKGANGNCSYVTTENKIAEASRGAVYGKEALLLSGLNEPQGLCLHEISNFIYENHNNVAPRSPYLRKRSNVACQMAKSDIFAARRSDDGDCGSKNYVLPDGKHSNSFIKACGACKETEFQKTMNCCGANNHLICKDHGAEANSNLAQRDNKADGSTNLRAAESWKPFYLEAAYHPEAIEVCVNHSEDGEHQLKETEVSEDNLANARLRAKKHLLALGWKIETRTRREDKTSLRVRFLSPEGNSYYSLHQACCGLLKEHQKKDKKCRSDKHTDGVCLCSNIYELLPAKFHPEPAYLQQDCAVKRSKREREDSSIAVGLCASNEYAKSNRIHSEKFRPFSKTVDSDIIEEISSDVFKENWRTNTNHAMSWKEKWVSNASEREFPVYNDIKPVYLPEAVLKYKNYMDSRGKGKQDADVNLMRLNARKHLMFMGWKFRIKKQKSKGELLITSPSGKPFRSLYSACDGYLEEENIKNSSARVSLKGAESGSIILSDFSEFRELGLCKLHLKGHGKSKKRKMTSHFSSFSFAALGDRLLKQPPGRSSIFEKSKRRKACQALIRQGHKLGSRFSPHVARSSKRSRQIVVKTPSHHVARTVLSLLIDNDMILPRQKVHYIRRRDGHVMMEGRITRDGIRCKCCKMVYSLTNFEAHAGSNNRRPAANIFLQDGRSLLQCQMQMIHHKKPKSFQHPRLKSDYSLYKSDTICSVCHDGGSLVLCDHCPSSFHLGCVGLEDVPRGKWFCSSCRCGICGQSEFNSDTEQFTEKTVLNCDQCEREYHVGCMRKRGLTRLSSCPVGNWFCSKKCSKIFFHLRKLLGKSKPTAMEGLSWTILRSDRENDVDYERFDAETMAEHDSKLCVALNVLHECFVTMIEPRTQSDFVADLLFNKESELNRLNFYGFYTMLLERGDELISVATFRVYGEKVAEMPLVGTRIKYRRQGMCRLLMNELEKLLSALGVERLVLPAVPQLLQTWTTSFGFTKMSSSDRLYFSEYTLLNFQDTTMCQKLLRTAPTVSEKPKGDNKELMDRASRSIEKVESENYSIVSEVVEMEPVKTVPSLGVETCPLPGEAGHIEQISYQTDAAHSPSVSACIDPVGQTVQKTGMNGLTSINIAPGKCRDSSVSVEMSPTVVVRPSTILNFKFFRKCYERVGRSGTIRGHLFKSINDRVASTFKYFYRRRISANKQTLFPRNDLASC